MTDAPETVRDSSRRSDLGRPAAERHVPVLLAECLDMLAPAIEGPGAVLVDATGGQRHEPALLGLVQVGLEVTDLDDNDVRFRDIHAEQLELAKHRVLVAVRGDDEAQATRAQQRGVAAHRVVGEGLDSRVHAQGSGIAGVNVSADIEIHIRTHDSILTIFNNLEFKGWIIWR